MDAATLKPILREEMEKFAGEGHNAYSYLTTNDAGQVYAVIDFATVNQQWLVGAVLIVRLVDDVIYIDRDQNTPTLFEALQARGVPTQQIVLTYQTQFQPAS